MSIYNNTLYGWYEYAVYWKNKLQYYIEHIYIYDAEIQTYYNIIIHRTSVKSFNLT